ncbi:MAG: hypothetical protein OXC02_00125 [Rhodobacteraceae bacterium]|nr:hypothetical protein [Paracoccaceae bacterium]
MTDEIFTVNNEANSNTSSVRMTDIPVLEVGNQSYPRGIYTIKFKERADNSSFEITHCIENAPLINHLTELGCTKFLCTVSSPISSYRRSHISLEATQIISWNNDDLGEAPLLKPMIVVSKHYNKVLDYEKDGVHKFWHGEEVKFIPGMRLAMSQVIKLGSAIQKLLIYIEDKELGPGEFKVNEDTNENFYFLVKLAPDLHQFLKINQLSPLQNSINTHIVSSCFSYLKRHYANEEYKNYRNLIGLFKELESKGLLTWTDDEFLPELAATKLYPHIVNETDK